MDDVLTDYESADRYEIDGLVWELPMSEGPTLVDVSSLVVASSRAD